MLLQHIFDGLTVRLFHFGVNERSEDLVHETSRSQGQAYTDGVAVVFAFSFVDGFAHGGVATCHTQKQRKQEREEGEKGVHIEGLC